MSNATRDSIRAAIFNQQCKKELVTFAGVELELRQPPIGIILNSDATDRSAMISKMLTDYCFVPGTNEKVFEDTDQEAILAMPFNKDWAKLQNAINNLTNLDSETTEQVKNSKETTEES